MKNKEGSGGGRPQLQRNEECADFSSAEEYKGVLEELHAQQHDTTPSNSTNLAGDLPNAELTTSV